jgi:hypothetical protein
MKHITIAFVITISMIACESERTRAKSEQSSQSRADKKYVQVTRKVKNIHPTVRIAEYNLITDDIDRDSAEADALIQEKFILPLAMQKHDPSLFDSSLTNDFTSRSENEFFDRRAYIEDRVKGKWLISDVHYENVVLQFFGHLGVLTYRNIVKETDENGLPLTWHFTWTDIWEKEDQRWKVKALRGLDARQQ